MVDVGANCFRRVLFGDDIAYRGDIFLADDKVLDLAVISRILAGPPGDNPASHTGRVKGLGQMAAGIAFFCLENFGGIVESSLIIPAHDAGLNSDGLVDGVEPDYLVHIHPHIQGNAAMRTLRAAHDGRAAPVGCHRHAVLIAPFHQGPDIFFVPGADNGIGKVFNDLLPQADEVVHHLAVGHPQAVKVIGVDILRPYNCPEFVELGFCQTGGDVELHLFFSQIHFFGKIGIRHGKGIFHHGVKPLVGVLKNVRISPLKY